MTIETSPSVLFVCTGNICRSPTAHALLVHKAQEAGFAVRVDSAAVSDEERGNPADRRSVAEAKRRGIAMPDHRARQITAKDFDSFDHVVGMTRAHAAALRRIAPVHASKVALMMDFAGAQDRDVPDPWYGDQAAFIEAFDMIEEGVDGLLARLRHLADGGAAG